jgi:hypothetical protein
MVNEPVIVRPAAIGRVVRVTISETDSNHYSTHTGRLIFAREMHLTDTHHLTLQFEGRDEKSFDLDDLEVDVYIYKEDGSDD